jgi:tight adherence protein C
MVIIFFLLTIALFGLSIAMISFEKQTKLEKRLEAFAASETKVKKDKDEAAPSIKRKSFLFKDRMRAYFSSKVTSEKEDTLQKKLLQAGSPFNMTVADYYIVNTIIKIAVPILFGAYGKLLGLGLFKVILLILVGFALSIKALDFYIEGKKKARYKKALREMPDFLDLLTICVEAGLGFDLALNKVISKGSGILCSEFFICLEEMRLGKSRKEALTGVKERLDFEDIRSFVNSLVQAERLGISIVQILRAKSEDERDKRKQRAEELANKMSIKILFPLIFFIFPSIFIVVFGPAAIQLLGAFSKVK